MTLSFYDVFPETPKIAILDIGAGFIGVPPPYQNALDRGNARVFAFEPNQKACDALNQQPGITAFPHFVGDGNPATFHATNLFETSSLLRPNTALMERFQWLAEIATIQSTEAVQTVRIDDFPDLPEFDYLKMDVQGAELLVLGGAQEKLKSCLVVELEVSFVEIYCGQPLFRDVDAFMSERGFQFHRFPWVGSRAFKPAMVNGDPGALAFQWLWSDAAYVRDFMAMASQSTEDLMKQAAILNDVIGSFDYSIAILQEIDRRDGGARVALFVECMQASQ